ncbi:cell division cycle-associated protein 2 isoform X1 [Oncorhynchus nerka]|uniref:cell division cycle-associated protein 2 isoform X1 n=1 Tax=Oncorhynchus nerka TaxID=8023 RepID=UPI001131665E|nr:cell division cycle-associated protein 2-like isoform X1 [Oncorhynchus nerka]XP_029534323.1 cell division cycle-associated protein 2-like isoform X1 [Oncorhynchus nerka]
MDNLTLLEASCLSPMSNITSPLDFTLLTPSQLGISTQSFTPSSNVKGNSDRRKKSRLAQLKVKRRSNVGVRSSPETNSLIRYIAQQRMKTPPTTPQDTQAIPFFPRVASTLKQKMAIFQSIMNVEENEDHTGGCIKTRDVLSGGGWSCDSGGKENMSPVSQHPSLTSPPSKRCCTARTLGECVEEIREATTPVLKRTATILKQQQNTEVAVVQDKDHQPALNVEPASVSLSPALGTNAVSQGKPQPSPMMQQHCTPTKEDQECSFELHSPSQPLVLHSRRVRTTLPQLFAMPSLLEMNPTDEADGGNVNSTMKKQVRFGILLPPELFDKNLPPSTPLRKGGTPVRAPTSAGGSQLRSLLKTPLTLARPDFSSPSLTGASPPLTMGPCCGEQESTHTQGKIPFPSMEEDVDSSWMDNAELETGPLDLTSAFQEEDSVCEEMPDAAPVPDPALEPEPAATARSRSRKRKQPEEKSEPVKKRSSRTAAKSAYGRMKNSAKHFFGKKAVDRSLYGKRDYASKNPTLSPITEILSSLSHSPQHPHNCKPTAKEDSILLEEYFNSDPVTAVVTAAALWSSCFCPPVSEDSPEDTTPAAEPSDGPSVDCQSPVGSTTTDSSGTGRAAQIWRRWSGPTKTSRTKRQSVIRVGRGKVRKVSVPVDNWLSEETEEQVKNFDTEQDPTETTQPEVLVSSPAKHTVPGNREGEPNTHCTSDPVDTDQCTGTLPDAGRSGDSPARADTDTTTPCPSPDEVSTTVAPSEQKAVSHVEQSPNKGGQRGAAQGPGRSRGRRSSIYASSVIEEEQASQPNGPQAVENDNHGSGMELGDVIEQASTSYPDSLLPPWAQKEFNIDDVLRPLPYRGHQSVRRSLRNQSSTLEASGLAWLPHTSPDSISAVCRKTRRRRSSIQALLHPPLERSESH